MKKVFLVLAVGMLVCLMLPAYAETAEGAVHRIDWTPVAVAVIGAVGTALAAILGHLSQLYIVPWLRRRGLTEIAGIVVDAVEAIVGRGHGEEKLRLALEKMRDEYGYNINDHAIIDAVKAAWLALDLRQIAAGAK